MRAGIYISDRVDSATSLVAPVTDVVRDMEQAGMQRIWAFDSVGRFPILDPLLALAIASPTTSLEVGTAVLQLPLRNPIELANRVLSLQFASQGRLTLGVGAGSTRRDHEIMGLDFDRRFKDLDADIEIFKNIWDGKPVGPDGDVVLPLWPGITEMPPIIVGSWGSERWIRRAAEEFAGWVVSVKYGGWTAAETGIGRFLAHDSGKQAIAASLLFDLRKEIDGTSTDPRELDYSASLGLKDTTTAIKGLHELGFDEIIIRCASADLEEFTVASEIIKNNGA